MRILHISNSADPRGGGPIRAIRESHEALAGLGHSVELACMDRPDSPWLRFSSDPEGMPVHALGPAWTPYRYAPRYPAWLREHATRFDCVILHGIWLHTTGGAWRTLRGSAPPYFVYAHGSLDPALRRLFPIRHAKKRLAWRLWEHRVLCRARAVLFTCETERRLAPLAFRPFHCRSAIVPYCIGGPPPAAERQVAAFLHAFPACRDRRVCLFLGRLHPKKGCDRLIPAFAAIARADPSALLVMAGPDPTGWRKSLEAQVVRLGMEARVLWTGMLEGDQKWGALRHADLFVLPSHSENCGIAVVEAMACGVPVLVTRHVHIWPDIESHQAGIVADDSEEAITDRLVAWWRLDAGERRRFRENARTCFERRFSARRAARQLVDTLHTLGVEAP